MIWENSRKYDEIWEYVRLRRNGNNWNKLLLVFDKRENVGIVENLCKTTNIEGHLSFSWTKMQIKLGSIYDVKWIMEFERITIRNHIPVIRELFPGLFAVTSLYNDCYFCGIGFWRRKTGWRTCLINSCSFLAEPCLVTSNAIHPFPKHHLSVGEKMFWIRKINTILSWEIDNKQIKPWWRVYGVWNFFKK